MVAWVAAAGAFLVSLDSTVNIAFPAMAASFGVRPEQMRWVIICYVLTYAVVSFVGGAMGDRVGHARVFRAGLALSAVAFALGGLAPTLGWLLVGRVVQGLAGGLVYGTAPGLVTAAASPGARGRALGFLNAAIGLALSLGPVVAGVLVEAFGWRAVFYLRIPLALGALGWAGRALGSTPRQPTPRLVGARDVLRARVMGPSALSFLANGGIFAIWLLAPFYLVATRGLPTWTAGVLFMLTPLGTTLAAPLAGRLGDRLGPRRPVIAGLAVESAGLALLGAATGTTPVPALAAGLFAAGFGLGLFQVPNMAVVMAAFPAGQQGAAGGLTFLARTLGIVGGVVALAWLFAVRRSAVGLDAAFGESFLAAAVAVAAAALAALAAATRPAAEARTPPP